MSKILAINIIMMDWIKMTKEIIYIYPMMMLVKL